MTHQSGAIPIQTPIHTITHVYLLYYSSNGLRRFRIHFLVLSFMVNGGVKVKLEGLLCPKVKSRLLGPLYHLTSVPNV